MNPPRVHYDIDLSIDPQHQNFRGQILKGLIFYGTQRNQDFLGEMKIVLLESSALLIQNLKTPRIMN